LGFLVWFWVGGDFWLWFLLVLLYVGGCVYGVGCVGGLCVVMWVDSVYFCIDCSVVMGGEDVGAFVVVLVSFLCEILLVICLFVTLSAVSMSPWTRDGLAAK